MFMAKIARFPSASSQVKREETLLRRLSDMHVSGVPEIVLSGAYGGRSFLVERRVEGRRLKGSNFSSAEKLQMKLDWMKTFYSQTKGGSIRSQELVRRAEEVLNFTNEFADLTEAIAVLDKCKPTNDIPTVCIHGDADDINFLSTQSGVVAVDFALSKFDEPPCDPYSFVSAEALPQRMRQLDVLSVLEGVDPFFLAIYSNIIHLGENLRLIRNLEENLFLIDTLREFPSRELGRIDELLQCYHSSRGS